MSERIMKVAKDIQSYVVSTNPDVSAQELIAALEVLKLALHSASTEYSPDAEYPPALN